MPSCGTPSTERRSPRGLWSHLLQTMGTAVTRLPQREGGERCSLWPALDDPASTTPGTWSRKPFDKAHNPWGEIVRVCGQRTPRNFDCLLRKQEGSSSHVPFAR